MVKTYASTKITGFLPLTGGTMTGNLLFTDNTYDIGASGATRPRTGYFGTSIFTPLIVGGTGTTSTITYKTTTGVGAAGADHIFQIGSNGATEAMRIINAGDIGIGTSTPNINGQSTSLYRTLTIMGVPTSGTAGSGVLELAAKLPDATAADVGYVDFCANSQTTAANKRVAAIGVVTNGATANNRGGDMVIYTKANAGALTERVRILESGRTGFGVTATAIVHIKAGTATASTAPLKLTSGTNLTTAEAGAFEYNGTNLFFTRSGTTREGILTQSAVTTEAIVSDTSITINIGGTTYKLLARA